MAFAAPIQELTDLVAFVTGGRILLILFFAISIVVIFRRQFAPIAKIPGPFLTRFTHLPIVCQDSKSNRTWWTIELHKKYGPLVRLSPNEVSCSSTPTMTDVYAGNAKQPAFPKGPLYDHLSHFGARNTSSSISPESHLFHKKIISPAYTQGAVAAKEAKNGNLWRIVGNYLSFLDREGTFREEYGQKLRAVDIYRTNTYYAADAATSHFFVQGSSALNGEAIPRRFIRDASAKAHNVVTYMMMEFPWVLGGFNAFSACLRDPIGKTKEIANRMVEAASSKDSLVQDGLIGGVESKDWGWKRYMATREAFEKGEIVPGQEPSAVRLVTNVIAGEQAAGVEEPVGEDKGLRIRRQFGPNGEVGLEVGRWIRDESAASELMVRICPLESLPVSC